VESPGASAELLRRAVITTDTALAGIVTDRVTPARIG
jgi:hypothetical protein